MSEPGRAIFLSYASQDAEAARKICEALRSGGVEVWFDVEGGLETGDEWDAKIRRQIKECVLFIPIISANTQARHEGYFRIEWELAAQRALGIASGVPFILPVVIDDTREPDALVPDRFRMVQWTKIKGGDVPADVRGRFLKLWSHRTGALKHEAGVAPASSRPSDDAGQMPAPPPASRPLRRWIGWAFAVAAVLLVGGVFVLQQRREAKPTEAVRRGASPTPEKAAAPASEARQLVAKARTLLETLDSTRDDFALAEDLLKQAAAKDGADAEVWACVSQLNNRYIIRGWDVTDQRRQAAQSAAQRALRLDPQSFEVRLAQVGLAGDTPRELADDERALRTLRGERPTDRRVLNALGTTLRKLNRQNEANAIYDESAALPGGDPLALYNRSLNAWFAGHTAEAETAIRAAIAQQPFSSALLISGWYKSVLRGDLDGALADLNQVPAWVFREDRGCFFLFWLHYLRRDERAARDALANFPRDWINDNWHRGPKAELSGDILKLAGRGAAAAIEWEAALKLVDARLAAAPSDVRLLENRVKLLAKLGRREEAERQLGVLGELAGRDPASKTWPWQFADDLVALGRQAEAIQAIREGLTLDRHAVTFPSATLRLSPVWDPLRGDPEFAKVIAEAEAIEQAAAQPGGVMPAAKSTTNSTPAAPPSPARELAAKALALLEGLDATREDFALAEDFCQRAIKLDSTAAEAWAVYAMLNGAFVYRGWEATPERKEQTRQMAERAIRLDPRSVQARVAQAGAWNTFGINRAETEKLLRDVVQEQPNNQAILRFLAVTVLSRGGLDECLALNERSAALPGGDPLALYNNARYLWQRNRQAEAYAVMQRSLAQKPFSSALVLKTLMEIFYRGDLAAAEATIRQIPQSALLEDRANYAAGLIQYYQRRADAALATWGSFPREFYSDFQFDGPKGLLLGLAYELDHRDAAAKIEWRAALQVAEKRLAAAPNNPARHFDKAYLLACLGEKAAAEEELRTYGQLAGIKFTPESPMPFEAALVLVRLGRIDDLFAQDASRFVGRMRIDPRFDALRSDPRFAQLLADSERKQAEAKK